MVTKHTFHDIHQWPFFDDAAVFAVLHWVHTIHNLLDMRQLQVLPPGAFPWTMILLIRRGKAREPGIALTTASSNPQRTVAPDGSNASFLQLRKLWADSERSDLIPWRLTDRETTSLGKRVLRCTLPQRFPHSTQPSNSTGCPRREGTKKIRTCVCEGSTPIPR